MIVGETWQSRIDCVTVKGGGKFKKTLVVLDPLVCIDREIQLLCRFGISKEVSSFAAWVDKKLDCLGHVVIFVYLRLKEVLMIFEGSPRHT